MRRIILFLGIVILIITGTVSAAWRPAEMLVQVQLSDIKEIRQFADQKFVIDNIDGNTLSLLVVPSELEKIRTMGYQPVIVISSMEDYSRNLLNSSEFAVYHDYNTTRVLVDSLISAFPQIIEKHIYGYSLLGRELYAVKISDNVQADEDEPEVSFDGCHHGDEIMGAEVIILFMRELCTQYGSDPQLTRLVNSREIWIYPFVNPDGRMSMSRYNNATVDVNRDWGYMWDLESPAPFSQPESQSARNWINENQFVISQTNHGGTESISYPWSYRPSQSPDHYPIDFLAAGYSGNSGYVPTLAYFQGYNGMYPINGSAKDAFYGLMGSVGWTLEVSLSKQPSPSLIPQYYNWNRPSMIYLLEMAGKGIGGMVTDVGNGEPVAAIISIFNGNQPYWPVYSDPAVGDFHKFLLPGTYSVNISANGYQTSTINNVTVSDTGATRLQIQLQRENGTFAYRVITTRIPGNNNLDEGYTPASLGPPDNINYSLGKSGYIILDMGEPISDVSGNDFRIVEGDASPEGYTVSVGNNWNGPWTFIGNGTGTGEFDLNGTGINNFRYLRLEDDGDGLQSVADAGFDLDAVVGNLIPPTGPFVRAVSYMIMDSTTNNNQTLEAGENASIRLTLQNLGVDPADSVSLVAKSVSPYLLIPYDSLEVGTIQSGQVDTLPTLNISAASATPHNSLQNISLDIYADGGYHWNHSLQIQVKKGAQLIPGSEEVAFRNCFINNVAEQSLVIRNGGMDTLRVSQIKTGSTQFGTQETSMILPPAAQQAIHVQFLPDSTLDYTDTLVLINNDPVNYVYRIPLSGTGIWVPQIAVSPDSIVARLMPDDSVLVPLTIQNNGTGDLTFTAQVGNYQPGSHSEGSGGNDSFGYIWIDSDESGGPLYDWVELGDGSGTEIAISGLNVTSDALPLEFALSFYGVNYQSLRVCSNGWISFTTYSVSYNNTALPSILAPRSMIAPLWDNLNMQGNSKIFFLSETDRFVVQWEKMYTATGSGPNSFEVILYDNGNIIMQYKELTGLEPSYTVGLQNQDSGDGFHIAFNQPYLHPEMSILISRRSWVNIEPLGGTVAPGGYLNLDIRLKTADFPVGQFWSAVELFCNDPVKSHLIIPIHLTVDSNLTAVKMSEILPSEYRLYQNFPNPFNPRTVIRYDLREAGPVSLKIYNLLGQEVRNLINSRQQAGQKSVEWDGLNNENHAVASGIYLYRLQAKNFLSIRKMILLK